MKLNAMRSKKNVMIMATSSTEEITLPESVTFMRNEYQFIAHGGYQGCGVYE